MEQGIRKGIELHILKHQIEKKINRFLLQEQKSEILAEQQEMLRRIKDTSTSGDDTSRKIMREYIRSTLLTGVELYEVGLNGELTERPSGYVLSLEESPEIIEGVLPFENPENLTAKEKFGILLLHLEAQNNRPGILCLIELLGKGRRMEITQKDIEALYHKEIVELTQDEKVMYIAQNIYEELYGLKGLDLLAYSPVNEIGFANDGQYVYVWVEHKIHLSFMSFSEPEARIIQERAISFDKHVGALNENNPEVLCHRYDGARVTVTQRPFFSARNCCIRIFNKRSTPFDELYQDRRLKSLSRGLVKTGQSIVFQGGLGTGKSTFMSILYEFLDRDLHVGLLEDMFELHIMQKYGIGRRVIESQKTVNKTLQNGVETFLRMSVDVAGLGEARNGEALFSFIQLVQAVSVSAWMTAQVNSPENTVHRMKNMLMGTGLYSNEAAAASDIVHNINFIVQNSIRGGTRYISEICEVVPETELANFRSPNYEHWEKDELEKEYYIQQLKKDVTNIYSLNRIYDNRTGTPVFVNYPSQRFVDRALRFPESAEPLKELFHLIHKDIGRKHELQVWWEY